MTKSFNCSKCQYFNTNSEVIGELGSNAGLCLKRAPNGTDSNSYFMAKQDRALFQAGNISDSLYSEIPVLLYKNQFELLDEASPLPICKDEATGLSSDELSPFTDNTYRFIRSVRLSASRINVGAASIGSNPVIRIPVLEVLQTTSYLRTTLEIPIAPSALNVFNTATDKLVRMSYNLPTPVLIQSSYIFGFFIDLDDTNSSEVVAQIRNPQITIQTSNSIAASTPFSYIEDKDTVWCGDFKQKNSDSSNLRCWDCDYFNHLNEGIDNTGQCRRNAPSRLDMSSIPDVEPPDLTKLDYTRLFANIGDGTQYFCGEFKRSTTTIPDPV